MGGPYQFEFPTSRITTQFLDFFLRHSLLSPATHRPDDVQSAIILSFGTVSGVCVCVLFVCVRVCVAATGPTICRVRSYSASGLCQVCVCVVVVVCVCWCAGVCLSEIVCEVDVCVSC